MMVVFSLDVVNSVFSGSGSALGGEGNFKALCSRWPVSTLAGLAAFQADGVVQIFLSYF
jgi:hypothetical protein